MKLFYLLPCCFILVCGCHSSPKNLPVNSALSIKPSLKNDTSGNIPKSTTSGGSLPNIAGYYEEVDDDQTDDLNEGCNISVNIKKTNTGYRYHLIQDTIHYRGKVSLEVDRDKNMLIGFDGIKYAEYEGDVSQKSDDEERPDLDLPVGIGGSLEGDTITIQNYGNAMNYYVKLGGCGVKYLRLVKKHK